MLCERVIQVGMPWGSLHSRSRPAGALKNLEPKLVSPSHHRPKQELIINDDGYAHGENGATDRCKVALRDRARDVGPHESAI
jgi:hypothetical protein